MRETRQPFISRPSYLAVALPLALIMLLLAWIFHPTIGEWVVIERDMPRYESQFGFRGGWIEYPTSGGGTARAYGVLSLDANGRLARLGFQEGDFAVSHHGDGLGWFCLALERANAGQPAELWVANSRLGLGANGRRKIVIQAIRSDRPESQK